METCPECRQEAEAAAPGRGRAAPLGGADRAAAHRSRARSWTWWRARRASATRPRRACPGRGACATCSRGPAGLRVVMAVTLLAIGLAVGFEVSELGTPNSADVQRTIAAKVDEKRGADGPRRACATRTTGRAAGCCTRRASPRLGAGASTRPGSSGTAATCLAHVHGGHRWTGRGGAAGGPEQGERGAGHARAPRGRSAAHARTPFSPSTSSARAGRARRTRQLV